MIPSHHTNQDARSTQRPARRMVGRVLLLASAPFLLGDGPPPQLKGWLLEQPIAPDQSVQVELVRARVKVSRRPGPLRMAIHYPATVAPGDVSFRVVRNGPALRVTDVYPASTGAGSKQECEPPVGERGPYWRSMVPLFVEISVPPGVPIHVRVLEELGSQAS